MTYRNWLPSAWLDDKDDDNNPFGNLRAQIDSLFDDFKAGPMTMGKGFPVRSNVSETDTEICVTAELPGIEMEDVDVSVAGNRLTIKGEKKSEKEEKGEEEGREFHRIERSSGSFFRAMTLPFDIEPDSVKAGTKNGVLTVTVPKPKEAVTQSRKIEIEKTD
ncbi:Hsp20/alpha crystallin family protein [Arenibacterium sp. CAU 1754]